MITFTLLESGLRRDRARIAELLRLVDPNEAAELSVADIHIAEALLKVKAAHTAHQRRVSTAHAAAVEPDEHDDPHKVYTSDGTLAYRFGDLG